MKPNIWHAKGQWWCIVGPHTGLLFWPLATLGSGETPKAAFEAWRAKS